MFTATLFITAKKSTLLLTYSPECPPIKKWINKQKKMDKRNVAYSHNKRESTWMSLTSIMLSEISWSLKTHTSL